MTQSRSYHLKLFFLQEVGYRRSFCGLKPRKQINKKILIFFRLDLLVQLAGQLLGQFLELVRKGVIQAVITMYPELGVFFELLELFLRFAAGAFDFLTRESFIERFVFFCFVMVEKSFGNKYWFPGIHARLN